MGDYQHTLFHEGKKELYSKEYINNASKIKLNVQLPFSPQLFSHTSSEEFVFIQHTPCSACL